MRDKYPIYMYMWSNICVLDLPSFKGRWCEYCILRQQIMINNLHVSMSFIESRRGYLIYMIDRDQPVIIIQLLTNCSRVWSVYTDFSQPIIWFGLTNPTIENCVFDLITN
jgi:hypothetical protein